MIRAHPLLGVGLGRFKTESGAYAPMGVSHRPHIAHNTYLEIAAELGLPACALYVAILVAAWRRARRLARRLQEYDPRSAAIARALEIGLAAFSLGALFLSAEYTKQLWVILSFGVALQRITEEEPARREAQELEQDANSELLQPSAVEV
jgi:O-antigen ligase